MSHLVHKISAFSKFIAAVCGNWTVLRYILAGIILTAAGLKAYQLATVPSLGEHLLQARWFNVLVVECELFFGIWLISGLLPQLTRFATIGLFSVFALVSFYKAISGETSCGCFGKVEVNPFYTATFDAAIVGMLLLFRKHAAQNVKKPARKCMIAALVWLTLGLLAAYAMMPIETIGLSQAHGTLEGKSVTLEPMKWLGKPFPLNDSLNVMELPNDWKQGEWMVLLHHRGCSVCEKLLHKAEEKVGSVKMDHWAIIEVPDGDSVIIPKSIRERAGLVCSLRRSSKWFAPSPVVLAIENGNVTKVQMGNSAGEMLFEDLGR